MTEKTKPTVSVTGKILFTEREIDTLYKIMLINSLDKKFDGTPDLFCPAKQDQLTAFETVKEIKKGIDVNGIITEKELEFGTSQKILLLARLDSFSFPTNDLEIKYDLIEKLQ